jgi:hypothetical protein
MRDLHEGHANANFASVIQSQGRRRPP